MTVIIYHIPHTGDCVLKRFPFWICWDLATNSRQTPGPLTQSAPTLGSTLDATRFVGAAFSDWGIHRRWAACCSRNPTGGDTIPRGQLNTTIIIDMVWVIPCLGHKNIEHWRENWRPWVDTTEFVPCKPWREPVYWPSLSLKQSRTYFSVKLQNTGP